jgi:hypothetical protein
MPRRAPTRKRPRFARESGVDAMAISVGNVHLQQDHEGGLDEDRIRAIEAVTEVPLVIHGGSGVPLAQRARWPRARASASSTSAPNCAWLSALRCGMP